MSVLVVVAGESEAAPLLRWGARFARARGVRLEVMQLGASEAVAQLIEEVLDDVTSDAADGPADADVSQVAPESYIRPEAAVSAGADATAEVVRHVREIQASLVVIAKEERQKGEVHFGARVLAKAPCDVMLIRCGQHSGERCRRVLVPAAGGPHAKVALQLADRVAAHYDVQVDALYVEPEIGEEAESVGLQHIAAVLKGAGLTPSDRLTPRVCVADDVTSGIGQVATEGYDLLMVGASDRSFVRRTLFGTVPAKLMTRPEGMAVAVLRSAKPLATRMREAADRWLAERVPQLEREDRISLFERLQAGSRFSFDFLALICLSTAIAALGLMQDSPAVVIGAMLVAPLLTPMLGAGLSLVQGNVPLVREAAKSIGLGFVTALAVGFVFGLITPIHFATREMAARGAPNILDLVIALLSGAAAAYAVARPNLSGALPGVAIAAALVPPIATAGICFAIGDFANGTGAAALFGLNLVAIILGCSVALYCIGVRGFRKHTHRSLWVRRTLLALILVAVVISFPLGSMAVRKLAEPVSSAMVTALEQRLAEEDDVALSGVTTVGAGDADLELVLVAEQPVARELAAELAGIADEHMGEGTRVRVVTRLATVVE